jgi:hypothetical protein
MTDRITQCDVVDCCEDCPRYADDCDGDKYLDRYPTMHEYAEGKRINPKLTDLISRTDAVNAVHKYFVDAFNNEPHEIDEDGDDVFTDMKSVNALLHHNKMVSKALKALPSADTHEIRTETHGVCSDLIRRADAIAYIDRIINSGLGRNKSLNYIHKYISLLPSANAVSRDVYDKRTKADEEIIDSYRQEFQKALSADAVQGDECDHCVYKWGMKGGAE